MACPVALPPPPPACNCRQDRHELRHEFSTNSGTNPAQIRHKSGTNSVAPVSLPAVQGRFPGTLFAQTPGILQTQHRRLTRRLIHWNDPRPGRQLELLRRRTGQAFEQPTVTCASAMPPRCCQFLPAATTAVAVWLCGCVAVWLCGCDCDCDCGCDCSRLRRRVSLPPFPPRSPPLWQPASGRCPPGRASAGAAGRPGPAHLSGLPLGP